MSIDVPNFEHYDFTHSILDAKTVSGQVELSWQDGTHSSHLPIWLRDHCACSKCIDGASKERISSILNIPDDLAVDSVNICDQGGLKICWNDQHSSHYHPGWLWHFTFHQHENNQTFLQRKPWDQHLTFEIKPFAFKDIVNDLDIHKQFLWPLMGSNGII